jgi:hypothetical protein
VPDLIQEGQTVQLLGSVQTWGDSLWLIKMMGAGSLSHKANKDNKALSLKDQASL